MDCQRHLEDHLKNFNIQTTFRSKIFYTSTATNIMSALAAHQALLKNTKYLSHSRHVIRVMMKQIHLENIFKGRVVTFSTFVQSDEEKYSDQQKDNVKDKYFLGKYSLIVVISSILGVKCLLFGVVKHLLKLGGKCTAFWGS